MILCKKCNGRVFVDRQYTTLDHVETYCVRCGNRNFLRPPSESEQGRWILQKEKYRAKITITSL